MMTVEEARNLIGARVTHQAAGVIHAVTDHYIWIRVDGDETALEYLLHPSDVGIVRPAPVGALGEAQ